MGVTPFQNKIPQISSEVFIADNATVIGQVSLGRGSSVWFGSVLRGDVHSIQVGELTNIQDHCVCHVTHGQWPVVIESGVTVGHSCIIHGCHIKKGALIGMGSVLLDGCVIGESAMIGARSLVTEGTVIPPRVLALGSPCKVVRDLTELEVQFLEASAHHYYELAQSYLKSVSRNL